jgi:hypothetical protein
MMFKLRIDIGFCISSSIGTSGKSKSLEDLFDPHNLILVDI